MRGKKLVDEDSRCRFVPRIGRRAIEMDAKICRLATRAKERIEIFNFGLADGIFHEKILSDQLFQ